MEDINMEQEKIGGFIASLRKEQGLTQKSLAEKINVTDKAVSKWENGRCLPDNSVMQPLCDALGITVNELLSGERLGSDDYSKKAEENIMTLINENNHGKKRGKRDFWLSLIAVVVLAAAAETADFSIKAVLLAGGIFSIVGFVSVMKALDTPETIGPNLAVVVLSWFYAIVISMVLLVLRARLKK
jgi:transcriptional regulator with XRE-family HTH domain